MNKSKKQDTEEFDDNEEENIEDEEEDYQDFGEEEADLEDFDEFDEGDEDEWMAMSTDGAEFTSVDDLRKNLKQNRGPSIPDDDFWDESGNQNPKESEEDRQWRFYRKMKAVENAGSSKKDRMDRLLDEIEMEDLRERKAEQREAKRRRAKQAIKEAEQESWERRMRIQQDLWRERHMLKMQSKEMDAPDIDPAVVNLQAKIEALEEEKRKRAEDEARELREEMRALREGKTEDVMSRVAARLDNIEYSMQNPVNETDAFDIDSMSVSQLSGLIRNLGIDLTDSNNPLVGALSRKATGPAGVVGEVFTQAQKLMETPKGQQIMAQAGLLHGGGADPGPNVQQPDSFEQPQPQTDEIDYKRWWALQQLPDLTPEQDERISLEGTLGPTTCNLLRGMSLDDMKKEITNELSSLSVEQRAHTLPPLELLQGMIHNQKILRVQLPDEKAPPPGKSVWVELERRQNLNESIYEEPDNDIFAPPPKPQPAAPQIMIDDENLVTMETTTKHQSQAEDIFEEELAD